MERAGYQSVPGPEASTERGNLVPPSHRYATRLSSLRSRDSENPGLPANICPRQAEKFALPEPGMEGCHDKTFVSGGRSPSDERGFTHKGGGSAMAAESFMNKAGERGRYVRRCRSAWLPLPSAHSGYALGQQGESSSILLFFYWRA